MSGTIDWPVGRLHELRMPVVVLIVSQRAMEAIGLPIVSRTIFYRYNC